MRSPKLGGPIRLVNVPVVIVVVVIGMVKIIGISHPTGGLRSRIGHGKVADLDIANHTAIGRAEARNEHAHDPHPIQGLRSTPSGLNRHFLVVIIIGLVQILIYPVGAMSNDKDGQPGK